MANRFIIEIRTKGFKGAVEDLDQLKKKTDQYSKSGKQMRLSTTGLRTSLGKLRNNLLLVTFAFGGLTVAVNRAVEAYRKQIEAETKLRASLRNVSSASEDGADKLIQLAAALQQTTTFADEHIIAGQAMLATFQLNEDAIAGLTERMLDMAVAQGTGGDGLTTIALQLGKAFTGQVGALSRSGVLIDRAALSSARASGATKEFAFLVGELDKNFKGLAQELGTTTIGQLDQLRNEISDMNEEMGRIALPVELMLEKIKKIFFQGISFQIMFWQEWSRISEGGIGDLLKIPEALEATTKRLHEMEKEASKPGFGAGKIPENLQKTIDLLREQAQWAKISGIELGKGVTSTTILTQKQIEGLARANELRRQQMVVDADINAQRKIHAEIDNLSKQEEFKDLEVTLAQRTKLLGLEIKSQQIKDAIRQAELKAGADLLNNLGRLAGTQKGFAMAAARLAQASAIIDTFAGANKAFAQGGVLGFFTGASIVAAGLANVKEIQNQIAEMGSAKHGADFVTSGPQMMMVGEGSGPEHVQVTPLVDRNIDGPQGGGVTINISGGVVQDDYVRNTLIPAINKATGTGAKLNA